MHLPMFCDRDVSFQHFCARLLVVKHVRVNEASFYFDFDDGM